MCCATSPTAGKMTVKEAMFHVICVVALCMLGVSAQVAVPGVCQDITVEQNFDIPKYLGLWYEYQRYFAFFQFNAKCVTATYSDNMNGTVGVLNYQVNSVTGAEDSIEGYARPENEDGEGKLLVSFPSVGSVDSMYWVLGTDYNSYSVVWSCQQSNPETTLQSAWLLTREREPTAETLAAAQAVIDANMLAPEFIVTDQTGCP